MQSIELVKICRSPEEALDLQGRVGRDDITPANAWRRCRVWKLFEDDAGRIVAKIQLEPSDEPVIKMLHPDGAIVEALLELPFVPSWASLLQSGWMYVHQCN
jgi:hypothetical protein